MVRALGLSAIIAIIASPVFAQDNNTTVNDSVPVRQASHYIGIQANQLVKQLLNLGGSTSAVNNPYLITYAVNSNKTGVGLNLSLGILIDEISTLNNQLKTDTEINDFFFRIGFEKKTRLGKRWILSAGGDIVADSKSNRTQTLSIGGGSSTTPSVNEEKISAVGGGFRAGLNFQISERIYLGTEANYYLKFITTTTTSDQQTSPSDNKAETKKFQLNVPAVLFLVVKL